MAPAVLGQSWRWQGLLHFIAAAVAVSAVVLGLSIAAPPLGDGTRGLGALLQAMDNLDESWETRNHAAWIL